MTASEALAVAKTLVGKDAYDIAIALLEAEKRALVDYASEIGAKV